MDQNQDGLCLNTPIAEMILTIHRPKKAKFIAMAVARAPRSPQVTVYLRPRQQQQRGINPFAFSLSTCLPLDPIEDVEFVDDSEVMSRLL
mmetsp:Transcript_48786/g.95697  ORF Transcript_48786/g.95697 Transcript_48786/m.95697 type:complete len:90 (+) Transcript_48786:148-417(+)